MNFDVETQKGIAHFIIKGNVMGGPDGAKLHDAIHAALNKGTRKFILDLGKVKFANRSGVGMLVSGKETIERRNGHVVLLKVAERIQSLKIITDLLTHFKNVDTKDEAIQSFDN